MLARRARHYCGGVHVVGQRSALRRQWQNVTVQLAVALAFADASIVVLALPQIIARLHTSISHATWVIMAYNLALITTAIVVIPFARRFASARALIVGLALFGLASIGCGLANSMTVLVPLRCVQGVGGGVLLCASLPVLVGAARLRDSPFHAWSAAAAIGMAIGPAVGGILTQIFDWRAIFLAQAPVAALTIALVVSVGVRPQNELERKPEPRPAALDPLAANAGLALFSAGLLSALFLVVLMLIDVWRLAPIAAAVIVSTIPLATALADRAARQRSPVMFAAVGAALVAGGLIALSFVTHRELGWVVIALALVGTGLGLSLPGLTTAALGTAGPMAARAAKTVTARDAGIVLGLLILTPVFVNQLHKAPAQALPAATNALFTAPLPAELKISLGAGLLADYKNAPPSELPDFDPTFARADTRASPSEREALAALHKQLDSIVETVATKAFKLPLRYGAIFALGVLALLSLRAIPSSARRRRSSHPDRGRKRSF